MMLIDDYVEYLGGTEGKAAGTITQYKNSINLWINYMKEKKISINEESIKDIKLKDIYGFLSNISNNNSNASKRNKISALKSFFEYCKEIKLTNHNIIFDIKKQPKQAKRIPKYFILEDCKKLLNSISGRDTLRNKMIITVFLSTGLRLEELTKLNVECIKDNNLTIIGKGNKERPVYLNSKVIGLLKEYLKQRPNVKTDALFLSERGNRISKKAVQTLVNNAIANAGLNLENKNDVSVHCLRHTAATLLYQSGVDIRSIQKILGHESISTTQIYTQVAQEQLQNIAEHSPMNDIL